MGTILLGHIAHIEWDNIGVAIPAFLTMVLMPFTNSGATAGQAARTPCASALAAHVPRCLPHPPTTHAPAPPAAVAYGVIAGLGAFVAIHTPFWTADYVRRQLGRGGGAGDASPGFTRRVARSKSGYHMRKTFGPVPGGPPSRADSFVGAPGYQDSYTSQDSRRSGLPITMMMGGGAVAAGVHHAGSVASMHMRSNPASISGFPQDRSHPDALGMHRISSRGISSVRHRGGRGGGGSSSAVATAAGAGAASRSPYRFIACPLCPLLLLCRTGREEGRRQATWRSSARATRCTRLGATQVRCHGLVVVRAGLTLPAPSVH